VIEVSYCRFRKRLAEHCHAALPLFFADHRQSFDVGKVLVIRFYQLAADVYDEQLAAVFFIQLYGHFDSFWLVSL
jgi:hypothetical protein